MKTTSLVVYAHRITEIVEGSCGYKTTCLEQGDKEIAVLNKALCTCVTLRAVSLAHNTLDVAGTTGLIEAVLALQCAQAEWCKRHDEAGVVQHDSQGIKVTNRLVALDLTDAFASDADIDGCHAALLSLLKGQHRETGLQYVRLGENRWDSAASADGQQLIEAGAAVLCTVLFENIFSNKPGEEQSTAGDSGILDNARIEREKQAAASF
jgi:hypothetical protein